MLQYRDYPIYIVYSQHSQENLQNTAADFYIAGDDYMGDWVKKGTGRALMEIVEDSAPAYHAEAAKYESDIRDQLETVYGTTLGRFLLTMLNPDEKIWIFPDPDLFWVAVTYPAKTIKEGGGIRIHFNPRDWVGVIDDTLVHELTHALRYSRNRNERRPTSAMPIDDFPNLEEFMATQIQNVYRSSRRKTQLYGTYNFTPGTFSDKETIYSGFIDNPNYILALKYCLDREPLARHLSRFPAGPPDFNPFRDFPILEGKAATKLQRQNGGRFQFLWL